MARHALSLICGVLFSVGLALSGMTRPSKVIGFLDPTSGWDPSLMFVMVGAIAVYAIAWRLVARRRAPLLGGTFPPPAPRNVDLRLVGGSALFGLGWGLGGYCPAPAITGLVQGLDALLFVGAMLIGMRLYQAFAPAPEAAAEPGRERGEETLPLAERLPLAGDRGLR